MISYALHLAAALAVYALLIDSINLLVGRCGFLTVAQISIFAFGAYSLAILRIEFMTPWLLALFVSFIGGAGFGLAMLTLIGRLRDDAFLLGALAIQMIGQTVIENWLSVTGGPYGLQGIPGPTVFGAGPLYGTSAQLCTVVFSLLCLLGLWRFGRSLFAAHLVALRDSESTFKGLGGVPARFLGVAFTVSGGVAALAGGLYASLYSSLDPSLFSLEESLLLVMVVVVGGVGSFRGSIVGALVLVILPELLRLIPVEFSNLAFLRLAALGLLVILFLRFRPRGILGEYSVD